MRPFPDVCFLENVSEYWHIFRQTLASAAPVQHHSGPVSDAHVQTSVYIFSHHMYTDTGSYTGTLSENTSQSFYHKIEFSAVKQYLKKCVPFLCSRQFDFMKCVCGWSSKPQNSAAGVLQFVVSENKKQKKITAMLLATIELILYHG